MLLAMQLFQPQLWGFTGLSASGVGMLHQDLGELTGPVLAFGGPYSNLQALQALMNWAAGQGVSAQNMICTGDIVAYCADATETTALMQQTDIPTIAGNCEKQIAEGADDCGCGFEEGSQCSILSRGWYPYALTQISEVDRRMMGELPDIISFTHQGLRYAVIHGGYTDIRRSIWSTSSDSDFNEEITEIENAIGPVDSIIAGHSGIPFIRKVGGKTWINAGAIGMPPNNGDFHTRFVLIDQRPEIHTLDYDWRGAQSAMRTAGLTQGYDAALETGYWPSEDVLPTALRR